MTEVWDSIGMDRIWDRQPDEGDSAWMWFKRYRDYGPERSLTKVLQKYNEKPERKYFLGKWSSRHKWVERVRAWDTHIDQVEQKTHEEMVKEAVRTHNQIADEAMELALAQLVILKSIPLKPAEWKGIAEFAVKTKRDALGMADQIEVKAEITTDPMAIRLCDDLLKRTRKLLGQEDDDD